MEILPLGDSAVVVRLGDSLGAVLRTWDKLEAADLPGVVDVAPALASVALFFDSPPDFERCAEAVRAALRRKIPRPKVIVRRRTITVPVCYDLEFALDLETVAEQHALRPNEVMKRHASARYRVRCLGFTPGFPYLSGLPAKLATPRRSNPRVVVPAGSVAIGGTQAGIYPLSSPGGWNVIGRTPLRIFDLEREPSALLRPGDRVRFFPITREEFERCVK